MEGSGSSEKWWSSMAGPRIMMEGAPNPPCIKPSLATQPAQYGGEEEGGPHEPNPRGSSVPTLNMGGASTSSHPISPPDDEEIGLKLLNKVKICNL